MARGRPSKKAMILDVAEQLFAQLGYQGTSIDLVVREAAVSKPTVYNNFPSKQSLIQELIQRKIADKASEHDIINTSELAYTAKIYRIFHQVVSSPFELAIYKMYYAEAQKLNDETLTLCRKFDLLITQAAKKVLVAQGFDDNLQYIILSTFQNGILVNSLKNEMLCSESELNHYCSVLEN